MLDVAHLLPYLIPKVGYRLRGGVVTQLDRDHSPAGQAVGLEVVQIRRLLELLLDSIGDLALHLITRRPRPVDADDHCLAGEGGSLCPAHAEARVEPGCPS